MKIRRVPRARLDDPGSIPRAKPGRGGRRRRNEAIARSVFDAFERQDMASFRQLMAPDAQLHIAEPCEGPGRYVGADSVTERFARTSDLLGPEATVQVNDVLASDSHAAVLFEVCDPVTLGSCAQRVALYRLSRGRIQEIRVHQEPSGALNA